ncbi:Conserved hypothetical protein [Vibrio atlanticus]|uniref:Type II toxin-antitoxin system RelE/ParE family toxin n=1 Tax=Vibrio atlanticus (strain LGP32) TaxID=575788 RepID=B7VPV5_VIBA3|nr:Conserved hypothetical protein [Vibrio atlanticus]
MEVDLTKVKVVVLNKVRKWIQGLTDEIAKGQLVGAISKLKKGLKGDWKPVGDGVYECRLFCSCAYRLYYSERDPAFLVVMHGNSKGTEKQQQADIAKAKSILAQLKQNNYDK